MLQPKTCSKASFSAISLCTIFVSIGTASQHSFYFCKFSVEDIQVDIYKRLSRFSEQILWVMVTYFLRHVDVNVFSSLSISTLYLWPLGQVPVELLKQELKKKLYNRAFETPGVTRVFTRVRRYWQAWQISDHKRWEEQVLLLNKLFRVSTWLYECQIWLGFARVWYLINRFDQHFSDDVARNAIFLLLEASWKPIIIFCGQLSG